MRETPTGSLHLRSSRLRGVAPSTPESPRIAYSLILAGPRPLSTPALGSRNPARGSPREAGFLRQRRPKCLSMRRSSDQTAPSLHSATNSEARNHDAENKKQNLNQISGVLWHRAFFPSRDDAEGGSFATSSGQTVSTTARTSSDRRGPLGAPRLFIGLVLTEHATSIQRREFRGTSGSFL